MNAIVSSRSTAATSLFAIILTLSFLAPVTAHGAEVAVQTAQLLPPGANTCAPAVVSGFTPYMYEGALHSFEFTVADSSYVAIVASVGSIDIPFNQMSRQVTQSGVRIHADLATTPIRAALPITVTMLSAKGGANP